MDRHSPKWATPRRQAYLARLLTDYLAQKGWQVDLLTGEFYHPLYEARIQLIIDDWVADDRAEAQAVWKAEQRAIHSLGERSYPLRGEFSAIAKDVFFTHQPQYYLVALGFSGLTFTPFAKVRLASSFIGLHVDLDDTLRSVSKNRRRKAVRYGKALPKAIQDRVDLLCNEAVRHYLA